MDFPNENCGERLADSRTRLPGYRLSHRLAGWLVLFALWGITMTAMMAAKAADAPLVLTLQPQGAGDQWRVSFPTTVGQRYSLEKSSDLVTWATVTTVTAAGASTSQVDIGIPGEGRTFWRVAQLNSSSQPVTVSPVVATYQLGSDQSKALLKVVTGGFQVINQVLFLDQGVLLGQAVSGLGGTWAFNLVWDGHSPTTRRLTARVTTEDGLTVETPVAAFLLADPAKFVPLTSGGTPAYGEFIQANATGQLGPFLFYPEGSGDGAFHTGAHFEFPSGGTLRVANGVTEIEFTSGRFFRGHRDLAPLAISGATTRRVNIDACNPTAVATAFGLPGGTLPQLLFGDMPLAWVDGALGDSGWAALRASPPAGLGGLGNFIFPSSQECVAIRFDPATGDPSLIFCFFGDWAPFGPGTSLRIPRAEPLKIYLNLRGQIAAFGTVEADFPGGSSVRGSVAWRDPHFELRFQGRNLVLPSLASLRRALPLDATQCVPSAPGATAAQLDSAAQCLTSIRDTFRALSQGGLAETPVSGNAAGTAPLATPVDTVGSALHAWASRVNSWPVDRPGQVLDGTMLNDLRGVVENAAATGEAARDLSSVLGLLRDILLLQKNQDVPLGSSTNAVAVRTKLQEAQDRLFAASDRILSAQGGLEPSPEFNAIVDLLQQANSVVSPGGSGGGAGAGAAFQLADATTAARLQKVMTAVKEKLGLNFLSRRAIRVGEFDGRNNPALVGLDSAGLLQFLGEVFECLQLLQANKLGDSVDNIPAGIPLKEATLQVRPNFERVHNAVASDALLSRDYAKLRAAVLDRARYFDLNARLGLPLASDSDKFVPNTFALLDAFATALEAQPKGSRAQFCGADFSAVDLIANSTTDHGANSGSLDRALGLVSSCSDLLMASSRAEKRCDDLVQALLGSGVTVAGLEPTKEGQAFPDISGRYESVENGSEIYTTLQINQGGRYFKGRLQTQFVRSDRTSAGYQTRLVEGWFLRPGSQEFACRATDVSGASPTIVRGSAQTQGGATTINLAGLRLVQSAGRPVFPSSVINLFERQQRDSVRAANDSPMHHRVLTRVAEQARALRLIIENYYSDAALPSTEQTEASHLNAALRQIGKMVSSDQLPLARMTVRQVLSSSSASVLKSKVARIQIQGGRIDRSHWQLALGMALEYPILIDQAATVLGVASSGLRTTDEYRYNITVQQKSFPLKAVFGESELDITIKKFRPDESLEGTFTYDGFITTAGISAGFGVTISDTTVDVRSPFNYAATDFNGELHYTQLGAGFAFADVGLSGGVGVLEMNGSGNFPPILINLTSISGQFGLAAQIGWDVGAGLMVDEGHAPQPGHSLLLDDIVRFDASTESRFDQAVFFEVDSDVVAPCGVEFLREFVAEYRSLFNSPKSFIDIRGFTDRTASDAYNLDLSQRRANRARDVILGLLGPNLRIPAGNITAIGLGEGPAAQAGVPDAPNPAANDARWRRVDITIGGEIVATVPSPAGRNP